MLEKEGDQQEQARPCKGEKAVYQVLYPTKRAISNHFQ